MRRWIAFDADSSSNTHFALEHSIRDALPVAERQGYLAEVTLGLVALLGTTNQTTAPECLSTAVTWLRTGSQVVRLCAPSLVRPPPSEMLNTNHVCEARFHCDSCAQDDAL